MQSGIDPERFKTIKKTCNGMLAPQVYERFYQTAKIAGPGIIVEVGAAHAAGTVALALGARAGPAAQKVFSFEKLVGGSREKFGGPEANVAIIERNLATFGASQCVQMIYAASDHGKNALPADVPIAMMVLDADGAIDRDFGLFLDRMPPGAPIIIDDYRDKIRVWANRGGYGRVDCKHKLTKELVDFYEAAGAIRRVELINDTWFGEKSGKFVGPIASLDPLEVYRSIIICNTDINLVTEKKRGLLRRFGRKLSPHRWLRKKHRDR